jgi:hypothetical protein
MSLQVFFFLKLLRSLCPLLLEPLLLSLLGLSSLLGLLLCLKLGLSSLHLLSFLLHLFTNLFHLLVGEQRILYNKLFSNTIYIFVVARCHSCDGVH